MLRLLEDIEPKSIWMSGKLGMLFLREVLPKCPTDILNDPAVIKLLEIMDQWNHNEPFPDTYPLIQKLNKLKIQWSDAHFNSAIRLYSGCNFLELLISFHDLYDLTADYTDIYDILCNSIFTWSFLPASHIRIHDILVQNLPKILDWKIDAQESFGNLENVLFYLSEDDQIKALYNLEILR